MSLNPSELSPAALHAYPAMKPPQGYHTDFANPKHDGSNAVQTIVVMSVLTGVTVVVLSLRLYSKFLVTRTPGWDDYTAIGATVGAIAYAALIIYIFSHGYGVHQWNVRLETLLRLTDYVNAITYIYKPFMLMAKISICLLFLNLFGSKPSQRWAIYFAMAYNVVLQVVAFFAVIFLCLPGRPSFWACSHKISILNIVTSGFNIFIDIYLLILPLFCISRLQMKSKRKLGICAVFLAGLLAVISSILGIVYRFRQNTTSDITWAFAPEIILVAFELEATIMVGCFPMLPALFKTTSPLALASIWYRIESAGSRIIHRASERSLRSLYTTDSRSKEPKTSQISDIRKTTSLESHEIHLIQSREA